MNLGNVHALTEITPAGVYQSGTAGYGSSALVSPQGLAIDANSNVYVTDVYPNTIVKFASNGSLISTFAPTSLAVPLGIAIDTDNTLWVASSRSVSHITAAGVDATGSPFATLSNGTDIALNTAGNCTGDYGSGANGYITNYVNSHPIGEVSFGVAGNTAG